MCAALYTSFCFSFGVATFRWSKPNFPLRDRLLLFTYYTIYMGIHYANLLTILFGDRRYNESHHPETLVTCAALYNNSWFCFRVAAFHWSELMFPLRAEFLSMLIYLLDDMRMYVTACCCSYAGMHNYYAYLL